MRERDPKKIQAIRKKAIQLIVKEGLDGFSMQKLARAAGVSPATLYIYYKDKDDLILQIFTDLGNTMREGLLKDFDTNMSFREGLKVQWANRANINLKYPLESKFMEHIRRAPQYSKATGELSESFGGVMKKWMKGAIARKEVIPFPGIEVFWAVAYAPLYQLIEFHQRGSLLGEKFILTEKEIDAALQLVLKGMTPDQSNK